MSTAFIIDNGSSCIRFGENDDTTPRHEFPTIVGKPRVTLAGTNPIYVGDEAYSKRRMLSTTYPITQGVISNWDGIEKCWQLAFDRGHIDPTEHAILLTESAMNTFENREKIAEIIFEKFNVPAAQIDIQAHLALFETNKTTGIVLDAGSEKIDIVPIYEGGVIHSGIRSVPWGGSQLTDYLLKLLQDETDFPYCKTASDRPIVEDIKEHNGWTCKDYESVLSSEEFDWTNGWRHFYILPDSLTTHVGKQGLKCGEAIFQPSLMGLDSKGIVDLLNESVLDCNEPCRKELLDNVYLVGGTSDFCGLEDRLREELNSLFPDIKVGLTKSPRVKDAVWAGASRASSQPNFHWVSKETYNEFGGSSFFRASNRTFTKSAKQ